MASAPAVAPSSKPALSSGTAYRLALFTTEPSVSQLDIVLTGSSGDVVLQLVDGPSCRWVWSSVPGPAHNKEKGQIDVYDLLVSDVGDISSVKLQFDVGSATSKKFFVKSVDDYNFKCIEILRVSNMRDAVFMNPNPSATMKADNTSVSMSSSGQLSAEESHVKLPSPGEVSQSPRPGGAASPASGSTLIIVSILTGGDMGSGSDGRVSIKFHGAQGETQKFDLDDKKVCEDGFHASSAQNPKDDVKWASKRKLQKYFEESQETFFRIETKLPESFGQISAVTLYHEPKSSLGMVDEWAPHCVAVNLGDSGYKYFQVPAKTKLDNKTKFVSLTTYQDVPLTKRPEGFLAGATASIGGAVKKATSVVKSTVIPAEPLRPKKNWDDKSKEYLIEVKTSDDLGAGTDLDIEVTLVGKSGECVIVLKEHPSNPARLEAEEPGKDFFEQSGIDRFVVSVPASQSIGDEITKIKVQLLAQAPAWDKSSGAKALKEGLMTGIAIVTGDKWVASYIKVVDFERLDGKNEFFFNCGNASMGRGSKLEFFPSQPVEKVPDNSKQATEEHEYLHIHDINDPAVEKPEPKGFFGVAKKKKDKEKSKEGKDKAKEEKDKAAAPAKVDKDSPVKDGEKGAEAKAAAPESEEKGLGDENDDDPDSVETVPKEILRIPAQDEKKTIEKGTYRVYIQISEGRDLVGKKENLMAEPVFQIAACGQKELTRNKKKKCRSLFVNQLFIFDFEQRELFDMDLAKIQISYLDGGSLFSTLLGSYEFDMSIIYHQDKHEISNVWVALLDSSGESLDIKGFVKLSIAVVGENDELPVHNDDEEDEEAGMDMTQCLMPPNLETKKNSLSVVCLKGEGFPKLSDSNMKFFVEAAFGAKRARTLKDENQLTPEWNEALRLPFVTPSMANDISISFKNSRRLGKNQTSGTLHVSLKDVMTIVSPEGNTLQASKYTRPTWFNIYGTPLEIQRESKFELGPLESSFAKAVKQSNMGLTVGSSYCGRVLLAIEAKEDPTAFRSVKGQILASLRKDLVESSPSPFMNPSYYKCRIVLHEGCQFKSDYVIVKAIFGSNSRQTDVCSKNTDTGTYDFYRSKDGKESCFPGDLHMKGNFTEADGDGKGAFHPTNGLPDVIIEVWNKDKSSRLAYLRVPVSECRGTQCQAKWRDLVKCPFSTAKGFPGFLLASISVEQSSKFAGDLSVYRPQDPPQRSLYWLVSHVYMARSLPSADSNGLSDPFVEIYCGGSKAVTSVRPETLNPVWYENLMTKVNLPVNPALRRPLSVMVWDQDFGSGALASLFSDDFLGSADVSWKDAFGSRFEKQDFTNYAEPTSWIPLIDHSNGSKSGEILLSFQLFPESQYSQAVAAGELNIVPPFIRDCQLQITALGCRNLAPFGIRSVNNALLEFDMASSTASVSAKGHEGKKKKVPKVCQLLRTKRANTPSGSDPNFSHTFNVTVNVPLNPLFAPIITIRCIDSWLFGLKTPMVGTGRILLESLVQPLIAANKLSPSELLAPPKSTDKDLIELGEAVKPSFGDGREKRLQYIVDFPHYPTTDSKYWPGVKSVEPWAQWAKDQNSVPISRHSEDKDFKRIFMNCFKFMNLPLPMLPHTSNRLIDALFKYCQSLEKLFIRNANFEIDKFNANPAIPFDQKKEHLKDPDISVFDVPDEVSVEVSSSTAQNVWSAFAVPHPSKSQEQIVRLYQLPAMLSTFGLDSDETILLRKCYECRWLGLPPQWLSAELASSGKENLTSAIDLESLFVLFRDIMSAASSHATVFQEQHFAIYQQMCSMTINLDVFFNFVLTRIFAELDIDGDKHIDLKESQRLLERLGYPCSFEIVKNHYSNALKVPESSLPSMFNFDHVKLLHSSIKTSAIINANGGELSRASYGSDVASEIVSKDASRGGASNTELKVLNPTSKLGDKEDAPLPPPDLVGRGADMFNPAAETEKEDDDVMPYMRGRATISESLDNTKYIGQAPFSTFKLLRGQKKGGFFAKLAGGGEEFEAGVFKGCVVLLAPKGSELQKAIESAPPGTAVRRIFPEVPKAPNVEVKQVVVRLYILKGYNMYCEEDSNLYLRVKLGKNVMQDTGKVCKGNNQLEFYQSFELRVELPGVSQLEVSVVEKNFFGFDTVVGSTTLDLEDRWYNEKWRQGNIDGIRKESDEKLASLKRKPVEECTLRLPSNRMPQGKISCWLDMMTEKDALKEPMFDISLVPPAPFEMRLVLWKARNMPSMETVAKGMNDLYLVASLISQSGLDIEKETDIHWRAKNGTGSFNWRMKFNFTLPQKRPRLRISAWDQDIFGSNDAIGESQMPLTKIFKQAWKAYCAKVRPDPLASVSKSKDGKAKDPPVSSSKNIIEYPPKPQKGDPTVVRSEINDEPAWVKLQRKPGESGGEVAFQLALMEQQVADARPVGEERKQPNRDPELPSPDRVRWSLLHPFDMLLDILGPDLYRKLKAALCVICCLSITMTILYFVGPLVLGNVLGAVAAKK